MQIDHSSLPPSNSKGSHPSQPVQPSLTTITLSKVSPIFRKKATWKCQTPSPISKYRFKGLSTIEIIYNGRHKITSKTLRTFCKGLKENKRVLSLGFIGGGSGSLNLEQISQIFNTKADLKRLEIMLNHSEKNCMKNNGGILKALRRYRSLSCLEVLIAAPNHITKTMLTHMFKSLKGLRKLKDFTIDRGYHSNEITREDHEPNAPIFQFSYPKSLKSLRINFRGSDLPKPQMLQIFPSNLSHCTSLECLDLDFSKLPSADNCLSYILEKTQKSLKTLRINRAFLMNRSYSDLEKIEEGQTFVNDLEKLNHLNELDLKIFFDFPEDASEQFLQSLFKNLASLTNLESLKLKLDTYCYPYKASAYENARFLKSLTRLHTLSFSLSGDTENPKRSTVPLHIFFEAFESLPTLKNLTLNLFCREISRKDIRALAQMFYGLTCLENLSLKLNERYLQDDNLALLYQSLAHLKLSSFRFNIDVDCPDYLCERITLDGSGLEGVSLLLSSISNFTSLSTLNLNFSKFELSQNEIEELSVLLKGFKQLTHLSLEFSHKRVKSLLFALKEMQSLSSLQLIFQGYIIDEEVMILASSFEALSQNLEHLDLQLKWAKKKKKKAKKALHPLPDLPALPALEKGLQNVSSLRVLNLNLRRLDPSKEEAAIQVLEALKFLKSLETAKVVMPFRMEPEHSDRLLREMGEHWGLRTFKIKREGLTSETLLCL